MKKKIEKKELKPTKHRQLFQVISLWFQCFSYDLWQMTYYPSMFLLRFQSSPFRQNTHWQKCVYEMDFALRLSSFFSLLFFLFFVHSLLFLSFYLPILFRWATFFFFLKCAKNDNMLRVKSRPAHTESEPPTRKYMEREQKKFMRLAVLR